MSRSQDSNVREALRIPTIPGVDGQLLRELNNALARVTEHLAQIEGRGDRTPTFKNDLDIGGHRVRSVGWSEKDDDLTPRAELIAKALYAKNGHHVTNKEIHAKRGVRVPQTVNQDHVVPLRQLDQRIKSAISAIPPSTTPSTGAWFAQVLTGSTGTAHTLTYAPTNVDLVIDFIRGGVGENVSPAAPTSATQFKVLSTTLTTFRSMLATDDHVVMYPIAALAMVPDVLTGTTGTGPHLLSVTPTTEIPLLRGAKLWKKSAGPLSATEYTISGNAITTGRSVLATDDFVVLSFI